MELFICKTCLYSSSNKVSFKKVERVKCILELLVPETSTAIASDTLICCQCYYFLKNVENFRTKSRDIQNQREMRYPMIDHNFYELSKQLINPVGTSTIQKSQSSSIELLRKETISPVLQNVQSTPITQERPYDIYNYGRVEISGKFTENFTEPDGDQSQINNVLCKENIINHENPICISDDDSIKYSPTISGENYESDVDDVFEEKHVIVVKPEPVFIEEENPSFFNKRSVDGYYNCKLCKAKYINSEGLYNHTRKEHDELKFFHCDACNFFSLWKSALLRHKATFHSPNSSEEISKSYLRCNNCSFKTMCKQTIENHVQTHFSTTNLFCCSICNKKWSLKHLFEDHLDAHRRGQILTCFICKNPYSRHYLKRHLLEIHGVTNNRNCKPFFM